MINSKTTVSLVLGSGGARGMAHVGVINWLEEHNINVKAISGCSIGSLIGGAYATGNLNDLVKWIEGFDKIDIYNMLDFIMGSEGFVRGDKVMGAIKEIIGTINIEDLPIKYTAVAADIAKEEEVWLTSGPINYAIRASISLPLFFSPYEINNVKLVDGGILNPTPIEPTLGDDTDITIAVNLGGIPEIVKKEPEKRPAWQSQLDDYLGIMNKFKNKTTNQWSMVYIADQSFNAMQNAIANKKLEINTPDFLINIPRNKCETLDFDRSQELIEYGYNMAETCLSELKKS